MRLGCSVEALCTGPRPRACGPMKKSKFSEAPIAYALGHLKSRTAVVDLRRELGIRLATIWLWQTNYSRLGGLMPPVC